MSAVLLLLAMMVKTTVATTNSPQSTSAMSTNTSSARGQIAEAQVTHNRIFGAYVLILGLTVFGTYFVWNSGNKVQDAIQRDADARIAEASSIAAQANASAASANVEVARANAAAAQANENAGKANEKAEQAKAQAEASNVIAEQSRLDKEKILHENLVLQQQVEQDRNARLLLERSLAPRNILAAQQQLCIGQLRGQLPISVDIVIYPGSPEAASLAGQIGYVFQQLKWEVHGAQPMGGSSRAVRIEYAPLDKDAAEVATVISGMLDSSDIANSIVPKLIPIMEEIGAYQGDDKGGAARLRIVVGSK